MALPTLLLLMLVLLLQPRLVRAGFGSGSCDNTNALRRATLDARGGQITDHGGGGLHHHHKDPAILHRQGEPAEAAAAVADGAEEDDDQNPLHSSEIFGSLEGHSTHADSPHHVDLAGMRAQFHVIRRLILGAAGGTITNTYLQVNFDLNARVTHCWGIGWMRIARSTSTTFTTT
jgi:hypothetical protein